MPEHKNIASALVAAQRSMGKALKQSENPHFRSRYADLGAVVDACVPMLNDHGIAVLQPPFDDESGRYVKTIFLHADSGESLECRVPLVVSKNDMQGYGSACTYARRYGLLAMAGIAPEDDDGNGAAAAPPEMATAPQVMELRNLCSEAGADESKVASAFGAVSLNQFPADKLAAAKQALNKKIENKNKS